MSETNLEPEELAIVRSLLDLAGLPASDHEVEVLAAGYSRAREQVAALWSVPEARYAEPALVFRAEPARASEPNP